MADEPRLSLVVLNLDQGATEEGPTAETEKFVTQVLKQHGKGFRKHANVLIFLAKVVHRGLFAYALGDGEKREFDTIYLNDKSVVASDCEITETAWSVRPTLAKTLMPEPEPVVVAPGGGTTGGTEPTTVTGGGSTGPGDDEWVCTGGKVVIKEGERRLNKVRVEIKNLPWENWHDIYNEVIQPLANEGADVHCQVVVIAKGDAAIRENTVELGIKESLGQRDIHADIQMG